MIVKVLSYTWDNRINSASIIVELKIKDYLDVIQTSTLSDLEIQRGKMISKKKDVYRRLIDDLKIGTKIPSLSLAIAEDFQFTTLTSIESLKSNSSLTLTVEHDLNSLQGSHVNILDGLQRTYCLMLAKEELEEEIEKALEADKEAATTRLRLFNESSLYCDIWVGITFNALLYKMLVLNTGQVKMSLRHQIEILNIPLKNSITKLFSDKYDKTITISTFKENEPISAPFSYRLSDLVEAYTAFSIADINIDKSNEVVQELNKFEMMNSLKKENFQGINLELFVSLLYSIECVFEAKYQKQLKDDQDDDLKYTSRKDYMGSTPFLVGFFAAAGEEHKEGAENLNKFVDSISALVSSDDEDPFYLKILSEVLIDEKGRMTRVGQDLREFFKKAFEQMFRRNKFANLDQCWVKASS